MAASFITSGPFAGRLQALAGDTITVNGVSATVSAHLAAGRIHAFNYSGVATNMVIKENDYPLS